MNRELKEQLNVIILSQHHGLSKPDQSSHGFSVDESKICGQPICPSLSRIFLTTKPFRNAKQITRSKSSRPDSIQTIQVAHRWKMQLWESPQKNPRTSKVIKMIRRGSGVDQELMPGSTSFAKGLTGKALCSLLCQDPYTVTPCAWRFLPWQ